MKLVLAFSMLIAVTVGCTPTVIDDADDDSGAESSEATTETAADDPNPVTDQAAALPHLQAFFAVPKADGTPDSTLEDKIVQLFDQAVPGSEIHISMFHWTHMKPAQHIVTAATTGKVHVHIIIDREANLVDKTPAVANFDGVDDDISDSADGDEPVNSEADPAAATKVLNKAVQYLVDNIPASITFCTRGSGSCQGTGIDHNKMYMFSELSDGSKNVVVQSSANLTTFLLHNNLVISRNDADLYKGYLKYWKDLAAKKKNLDYYTSATGNHTIAYFFPRAEGDTIISVLDKVKCVAADKDKTKTKIRVAMAFFTDGRMAIADKLVDLRKRHCSVQVVMRKKGDLSSATIINKMRNADIVVGTYPDAHANIHSKYLLIDGLYDTKGKGHVNRQLVFTGSHNYTGGALRTNDETLIRIDNAAVFDAFFANWKTIRAQIN